MYSIVNLGTILVIILVFPTLVAIEFISRQMTCKYPIKMNQKLKKALYWNSSIMFFRESFVIALISVLINLKALTFDTAWETISSGFTILLFVMLIVVPIALVVATWRNFF